MPSAMQANVGAVWAAQENMVFRLRAKTMYFLGVKNKCEKYFGGRR